MEIGNNFLYCCDPFEYNTRGFKATSIVVVILYWIIFMVCVFCSQKIYAVEMMFVLQFAFISLIPIGTYCPPFTSLSYMRYSFGWNDLNLGVSQKPISLYYSSLEIQSNFLSNFNAMFIPFPIFITLYLALICIGRRTQNSKAKLWIQKHGKTLVLDVPLAFLFVNIPNICVSFVVGFQTLGIQ